ncbi:hypothetical protein Pint_25556 [Pistacia integerrima]|uniref:Uncharacterized protein n=1 Tax=Pistacia integerrima TaxID=434235 RepID=A0ACC0YEV3_9ROSI|nr:hypothetical protein Pint_25556 [Pistacia integerrima]
MVARTMVLIIYDDWRRVPEDLKRKIWDFVCESKENASRHWSKVEVVQIYLNKHFIIPFVDNRSKLKQETRLTEEEIDRSLTWKLARKRKGGGYDSKVAQIVEKISDLETKAKTGSLETDGKNDILNQALGTKEHLGSVQGMETFITHGVYFEFSKNVRDMMTGERDEFIKKFNALKERLEKMSNQLNNRSLMFYAGSNHQPLKGNAVLAKSVVVDNTCYLVVDSSANIVAKGTIIEYKGPNVWVTVDMVFDGSPSLPFPDDEEFLVKVFKKLQKKKYITPEKVAKKSESMYNKVDFDMGIKNIDLVGNELAITLVKSEPKQMKLDKQHTSPKKRKADVTLLRKKKTRQSMVFKRRRVQNNSSLKMFSTVVNHFLLDKQTLRVQTDDNLFGYESYTYVSKKDFERALDMEELTALCITVYIM